MHSPHLFLVVTLSVGVGSTRMSIMKSSPEKSTMVREGESLFMSCEADLPWFLCVWTSPQGGKQCAIQEGEATTSVCQGDPRVQLEGGPTSCTVRVFGVQREDRGNWMCLLQDGENFQTDRKLLEVEVATRGQLEVMVKDKQLSEGVVRLTEGDKVELECKVQKAFPRPSISWSGLEVETRVGREVGREEEEASMQVKEEVEYDDVEGTFSSTSTLHYTARLEDANSSLVCSMLQTDKQGVLLYRQEASLTLDVVSPPPPVVTASSTSLSGLILGSSVGALFVLLLVFLLTFVLCRIRRQKRKEPSPDPCPPPHNQPSVWTSNCSSNWTCQQREMTATSSFEASNSISSNSSSSFQTNRSLGDLPTLTTLHGMRPPSSPLGLHHHILSCRSSL